VKVPTGDAPQLPREIHVLVASLAKRLGREVASDELFLLALLELPEGVPARSALEAEKVTSDRALAEVRTAGDKASKASESHVVFPPAYNSLLGRAQAFAATLGDGMITPEHVLLALIWDPSSGSSQLLWRLGIERERIVERLASQGMPTPRASIPDQREVEMGKQVWFDRSQLSTVLQTIGRRIEPGTRWGFNYEGERAWVWAEAHVELRSLVDEALSGARKNG
jgi:ATP-dependent Clp protease ATP-binding subunit ClpA